MVNKPIKNQEGNLHTRVQNICCSPTGCGRWGCRIVTQCDALGYIYMSLSGSGVNGGYSFNQRVALGYIYMSLSGSCMHTNVVQKARRAKTHLAQGNALWFENGTYRQRSLQGCNTYSPGQRPVDNGQRLWNNGQQSLTTKTYHNGTIIITNIHTPCVSYTQ